MKYRRNKPKEALFPWKIWVEFPGVSVVKNPPVNAGDAGYMGSVPGSGRSPGEENGNPLQWTIPWAEEFGGLQSMGSQKSQT